MSVTAQQLGADGALVRNITLFSVLIYELAGPVMTRIALTRAGDITPRVVEHNAHRLMQKGARVFVFEGGFHHSKILMVDGRYAFVGSANLNSRSLSNDYECNLLVADEDSTEELRRIFD